MLKQKFFCDNRRHIWIHKKPITRPNKRIFLLKIDTLDLKLWAKLSDASINDRVLAEIEKLTDIHANKVSVEFYGEVGTELQYIAKWKNWYKENKNDLCFDNSKGTLYLGSSIK